MLLSKQTVEENATLALWEVTETIDELLDLLHVDPFIVQEISLFTSNKRKLEYLATRVLLQEVLDEQKTIAYTKRGKPYLVDKSFQISITHTGKYVAILLHPTYRVGIDIEKISDKVVRVQSKFLSDEERTSIDHTLAKTHLALLWSAKEALYKILGQEEVEFTNHLTIEPFKPYLMGTMKAKETRTSAAETFKLTYHVFPEFVLVWTVKP
ncbi:MAG TPA: 4'-phosphopantetheinyl transferase superfamily protein [Paludibacteraceae bacterium]|jgi:phosphopantetheine--protein transferase-like protein|nr:4'-phosphopantetheinyl transferase superfamily protein [Paludibacteraceae bacterium]HQB68776.1 4'-phosphopantetheinyl transferase superfamily protein [Paludibacteraceae bacterium]HRS67602.1 4'-phosphopantetheinyl transferase superfamily protein [Paludibacteraceae bacterium]